MGNEDGTNAGRMIQAKRGQSRKLGVSAWLLRLGLTVFLCGLWQSGFAATDQPPSGQPEIPVLQLSLRDAMQAAIDQNPSIRLFKERITQAQDVADTQLGELLPNLSGGLSYSRRRFFLGRFGSGSRVSDPTDFYDTRAFLTQNVFSLSLIQRWRAAKTGVEVAGLDAEVTKRDTMATVGLVYLETLRAKAAVEARKADVLLNKVLLRLATERKAAGMATRLDVTRSKVQLENERQRLLAAEIAEGRATLNLIRAMGISFDVKLVLTDELTMVPLPEQTMKDALQVAQDNRTELKAQKRRERLASLALSSVTSSRVAIPAAFRSVARRSSTLFRRTSAFRASTAALARRVSR